jgi:hypothetical protein
MLANGFQRHPAPVSPHHRSVKSLAARRLPGHARCNPLRLATQAEQAWHQIDSTLNRLANQDTCRLRSGRDNPGSNNALPVPRQIQAQTTLIHTRLPEKSLNNTQKSLY